MRQGSTGAFYECDIFSITADSQNDKLLIVSAFLFAQIASASQVPHDVEDTPEHNVCVVCLVSAQDDDGDVELLVSPIPLTSSNTLGFDLGCLISDGSYGPSLKNVSELKSVSFYMKTDSLHVVKLEASKTIYVKRGEDNCWRESRKCKDVLDSK